MLRIHGTSVALCGIGVLLRGPSGCGKSDLALRLIDGGAVLVADDVTEIDADGLMRPPAALAGLIEVRGLGILPVAAAASAMLGLVADLAPAALAERLPDPDHCDLHGRRVRRVMIDPARASAPARLRLVAGLVAAGRFEPVPAALAAFP